MRVRRWWSRLPLGWKVSAVAGADIILLAIVNLVLAIALDDYIPGYWIPVTALPIATVQVMTFLAREQNRRNGPE